MPFVVLCFLNGYNLYYEYFDLQYQCYHDKFLRVLPIMMYLIII